MPGVTPEPNYHGRRLQRELRRLRELNRLTQEEAGERVHIEFKKLSRIERRQLPTYHELVMLLDAYGVVSCDVGPYIQLWEQAKQRPWWREFHVADTRYLRMEDEADHKYEFQLGQVPTLLQTERYARETFGRHGVKSANKWTKIRMRQQERLAADPHITLHALVHEPVLHQGVDQEQVQKLVSEAMRNNVILQIVPQFCLHDGLFGSVALLSFNDKDEPQAAFTETLLGVQEAQDSEQTRIVRRTLDDIAAQALSPDKSLTLLEKHLRS